MNLNRRFVHRGPMSLSWIFPVLFFAWILPCPANWSNQTPPNYVVATTAKRSNIFYRGEAVQFALDKTGVSSYEVRDYYGTLVESAAHDATQKTLNVGISTLGWYKLYLYGQQDQGAPWGKVVGGSTFVVVRTNPNFPPLAEPSAPTGWYPDADDQLRGFIGSGPQRLYVLDASQPAQAITQLDGDLAILKANYLPYDPVRKRVLIITFPNGTADTNGVRQIVDHFKNDVQYYEGRNEPNSGGSIAFALEEQAFYNVVKGVSPTLKVLGPSVVSIGPAQKLWIDGFLVSGGAQAIDAFAFHAYNCVNGDPWLARQTLTDLKGYLLDFGGLVNEELWQTEQGYMAAVYGAYQPRLQGRWTMLQMMIYEQFGIPKEHNILWYDRSHGYWEAPFWMENDDGSLNPGAPLMRVWSEELYGTSFSSAYDFGTVRNNQYVGSLFTGPGKNVAAFMSAGNPNGQVTLSVQGGSSIHIVSPFGVESNLPVAGGTVTLPVSELPVYVELAAAQQIAVAPENYGVNLARQTGVVITADGDPHSPLGVSLPNSTSKLNDGLLQNWYYDQQPASYPWMSNVSQFPAAVEIDLPTAQPISDVIVYAGVPWQTMSTLLDYELQYWDGTDWKTIEHVTEPTKTFPVYTPSVRCTADSFFSDRWVFPHHFTPVTTGKIRLLVHDVTWGGGATADVVAAGGQTGPHQIVLREIEIYNRPAATPVIQTQPASQTVAVGNSMALSVNAGGTGTLQYQWRHNGVDIAGATGPILGLSNLSLAQQGNYDVSVSNAAGSVLSSTAVLTVKISFTDWTGLYFPPALLGGAQGISHDATQAPPLPATLDPSAPDADPDGDGIPNLLEYVFGTNPIKGLSTTDAAKVPVVSLQTTDGVPYVVFSFRLSSHSIAQMHLEGCADLGSHEWQTVTPDGTEINVSDPLTLDETIQYKMKATMCPWKFFRLRAWL